MLYVHSNLRAVGHTLNCSRKHHTSLFSIPLSTVLSTFAKLQKVLAFSCLSVSPHGSIWLPLDRLFLKLYNWEVLLTSVQKM